MKPTISITPVTSGQISGIGYDPASKTLAVQFHKRTKGQPPAPGSIYHYAQVPAEKFDAFLRAESKGTFLKERIKGQYDYEKQEEAAQ